MLCIAISSVSFPHKLRDDTYVRVYLLMALRIMILDMLKLGGLSESRNTPIKMPHPIMQSRISGAYVTDIALEMLYINWVKANDGGVEAYVSLGDVLAKVVRFRMSGQVSFSAVKGGEKGLNGFFVGFLRTEYSWSALRKLRRRKARNKGRNCRVLT